MIPISEESLKFRWLTGARWWACLGLLLAFAVGHWGLGLTLAPLPFTTLVFILAASNTLSYFLTKPPSERLMLAIIVADVLLFTTLLFFYGGSANPLSSVYFLYVILASILLRPLWSWITALVCSFCFASLFFRYIPIPELTGGHAHHHHHHLDGFSTHLQGMLITFVFTAFVIVYFISRLTAALRARDSALETLKEKNRHSERLAALTTLAAGAAHELRNPLATISVALGELERELQKKDPNSDLQIEAQSIKSAVSRCQKIIDNLCANAGVVSGEPLRATSVGDILQQLLDNIPDRSRCAIDVSTEMASSSVRTFTSSLVQALLSLVRNGLAYGDIRLTVMRDGSFVSFAVYDSGPGIPKEMLPRLGEPFFTTKSSGEGLGLGLFITKTFAERLGGTLLFESASNRGTIATLSIPDAL